MIRKKIDIETEKSIITGMIVDPHFLKVFCTELYDITLFQLPFARTVASWCFNYWEQYDKPPAETLQAIYEVESLKLNETESHAIGLFLDRLSGEYDSSFNTEYHLDKSEKYLKSRKLKLLSDRILAGIAADDLLGAEADILNFNQISRMESKGIDLFRDYDKIEDILTNEDEVVFRFRGELGRLIEPIYKGDLFAYAAPDKRGKSWWIQEIDMEGVGDGKQVAHFNFELGERKVLTRRIQSVAGQPVLSKYAKCQIPYFTKRRDVKMKTVIKKVLTPAKSVHQLKRMMPVVRGSTVKIMCWPSKTKTIRDIKNQLDIWESKEGFVPEIISVDQADNLSAENTRLDARNQIDDVWNGLKGLAQERNVGVVTATHTAKETYDKKISKKSPVEDRRKAGHCDQMVAIDATDEEKKNGIMRLSKLFLRDGDEESWKEAVVLGCLAIGRPYLDSYIRSLSTNSGDSGND